MNQNGVDPDDVQGTRLKIVAKRTTGAMCWTRIILVLVLAALI